MLQSERPDPDSLVLKYQQAKESGSGSLKVFFGYAAGVGKTYAMLRAAIEQQAAGVDVLVGYVEPHPRPETAELLEGLPTLATKKMTYRQLELAEFDIDRALALRPELILVDELAHTNVTGSRNRKRYQDIQELLRAGIDVYTTVNVQHLESLNDIVADITGIQVNETVPDSILESALIKLIDVEPAELLSRLEAGKIYQPGNAERALNHFFTTENLSLLREIAIRKAADHISLDNQFDSLTSKKKVQGKLLVYLDHKTQVGAEKCLRWTARLAAAFRVEWVVLFIQSEDEEGTESQAEMQQQLDLAEKLGSEVVVLNGDDKVATLIHYARITGVTDIVIGKNRQRPIGWQFIHQEIEDVLINELSDVEIHMIPYVAEPKKQQRLSRANKWFKQKELTSSDLLKTVGLILIATILSEFFLFLGMGDQNVIIVYLFVVLIISRVTEGYIYGVLASIASVLLFNWFFVTPLYSLTVYKPGYPITLVIMLGVALITSNMMMRVKKQALESIEKEHQMEIVYELNQGLLSTESTSDIMGLTNQYLAKTLERSIIFYTEQPNYQQATYQVEDYAGASDLLTLEDEQAVANWVFNNSQPAGHGSDTLMGAAGYYLPVLAKGNVLGVIGVLCQKEAPLTHENHNFLKLISSQISLALERQLLLDEQQQILVENEKEKMRGNLLRAISHDLRTPLTGILGASSALIDHKDKLAPALELQLLTDIKEDSEWLIRMVENLLSVTRIDEGTMRVKKRPEAVEEVVGAAINRIRKRFKQQEIDVNVPESLIMLPMDGKLIEQVLINLLENAIKHSGTTAPIKVEVTADSELVQFSVSDQGKGLAMGPQEQVFNSANEQQIPSDSRRGLGIGLSICRTIVAAHDGVIEGRNTPQGGAEFIFTLPLKESQE